jgi:hypothetical protein
MYPFWILNEEADWVAPGSLPATGFSGEVRQDSVAGSGRVLDDGYDLSLRPHGHLTRWSRDQ